MAKKSCEENLNRYSACLQRFRTREEQIVRLTSRLLGLTAIVAGPTALSAQGLDLEVMHWWTSGGEAAAVAQFAEALNSRTEHTWIDGAIAGGGDTARPVMVSRIIGGDPPAAFQFNHGRQAEELIEAGLMLDLTDVAEAEGWLDIVNPPSLLDACTVDGRIYCAPVNIHSWQWMWLSNAAFEAAGVDVPSSWTEFVETAPALREAGVVPLAMGGQSWQQSGAFGVMSVALAGEDLWLQIHRDKDADAVRTDGFRAVLEAFADARELARGLDVQDWNLATAAVISGSAAAQIMGDWAKGEFAVAG
ncbi:MAG: carbohydrate ABC transporter substrate-binding protein, partial [Rubellimicrobium sp.]|nr:carbohydrate ABC transporter substrate-binding protein [Rubellimicrobium sp.]